jgi:hypothetical protein
MLKCFNTFIIYNVAKSQKLKYTFDTGQENLRTRFSALGQNALAGFSAVVKNVLGSIILEREL